MTKKRGLGAGRGLDALLGSVKQTQTEVEQLQTSSPQLAQGLQHIAVTALQRGAYQPRKIIASDTLAELAESIKNHGVMQPIVVRAIHNADVPFEIIAGERRWRAAQLAGLATIPAIVREITDEVAIALALIENIQREDLNPIEQAQALQRFADEFDMNHQQIADTVGKARTTVTNLLRLIGLQEDVKTLLSNGDLEMGHARALLAVEGLDQVVIARQVVAKGLTVRQTEKLVRETATPKQEKSAQPVADISALKQQLSEFLAATVEIDHTRKGSGKIVIKYHNLDELDGLLSKIVKVEQD